MNIPNIPKISLIICAYNEEHYIGTCLNSVLKNSGGKFFEILVIDNASTDRTAEVAGRYTGVRVVREEQKGLTRARQRGFLEAKGDVLAYIDADTKLLEGWVDQVIREFQNNENLAVLSGPYRYYDVPKVQEFLVSLYWNILAMPAYWIVGYMTIGGNFAIRKTVLEKMHGFDTKIEFYGEDTDIARRAHEFGKVKFMPSFKIETSGRRIEGDGLFTMATRYVLNFASQAILKKPVTDKYTDIRK